MSKRKHNDHPSGPQGQTVTVQLPDRHTARFLRDDYVPVVKDREITIVATQINNRKMKALAQAQAVEIDGVEVTADDILLGERTTMSEREARLMFELTDVCIWAYLHSWTYRTPDGEPLPLPETPADVAARVPSKKAYDVLAKAANEQWLSTQKDDEFTVDGGIDAETGVPIEGTPTVAFNS